MKYYKKDVFYKDFTKIQLKTLEEGCPECGGKLHGVGNNDETEVYLYCDDCLLSMDSDGGYTN